MGHIRSRDSAVALANLPVPCTSSYNTAVVEHISTCQTDRSCSGFVLCFQIASDNSWLLSFSDKFCPPLDLSISAVSTPLPPAQSAMNLAVIQDNSPTNSPLSTQCRNNDQLRYIPC